MVVGGGGGGGGQPSICKITSEVWNVNTLVP